ncbi:MAG: molybdopterin cofactor-binding domain-containing protein [Rhodothalassiaceae bacterium]
MPERTRNSLSRRGFLAASAGAGLTMAFAAPEILARGARAAVKDKLFDPAVWFVMDQDGWVTVNIAKAEMGQHVGTALARILVDELEADWSMVRLAHVDSDPKWGYMVTGGSWSVHTSFEQMSRAGAAGRLILTAAAADLMDVDPADCRARNGRVEAGDRSMSYAEIVRTGQVDRSFSAEELEALPIKTAAQRRLIGQPIKALDVPAKTRGEATYGIDAAVDGMVHARPLLPPTRYGSTIRSIDDAAAKAIPGYRQTIQIDDPSGTCQGWAAVIADTTAAAFAAGNKVVVDWQPGETAEVSEEDLLAHGRTLLQDRAGGAKWVEEGDVDGAFDRAEASLRATYTTNTVLHMPLEPVNALALEQDGHWHLHGGNQWQSLILPVLAKALEVEESRITLHQYFLGGGFGRRLYGDYFVPTALASKALGVPVKMVFTREDDARFDCVRSPSVQNLALAMDGQGRFTAMEHYAAAGWPTLAMAQGFLAEPYEGGGQADSFSIAGADHWYSLPAHRVRAVNNDLAQQTFLPGWLRAVGPGWTTWAVESFLDEAAVAQGRDAVALRLDLLDGQGRHAGKAPESVGGARRLAAVLERCAAKAGWGAVDLPADTGLGVACSFGQERTMPTWTAVVARVRVDRATGTVKVEKLTQVIDAGTIVHPDGALAQAEGASLWGVSLALHEATRFDRGQVADRNFDTYSPLRMADVPELDIEFIDSTEMPVGLGEPPLNAVAPAIANAIHAAVGARVRDLPMTPDRVKAALKG